MVALIVEDGTAKANADSLCSIADADDYFVKRNDTAWAALTDAQKEAALRASTEYMEGRYRHQWNGFRKTVTQSLSWPRSWVPITDVSWSYGRVAAYYADNYVPLEVKNACASLALRAHSADLLADQTRAVVSESIGPIAVTYDRASAQTVQYKEIDAILAPYLAGAGGVQMVRI